MKIITAAQAGALIPDNATIFLGSLAVSSLPEEVLKGIEKNFLDHGSPKNVTTWACGAIGNSKDAGMVHFAHPGMIKRTVAGHFGQTGAEMMKMVFDGEAAAREGRGSFVVDGMMVDEPILIRARRTLALAR